MFLRHLRSSLRRRDEERPVIVLETGVTITLVTFTVYLGTYVVGVVIAVDSIRKVYIDVLLLPETSSSPVL